MELNYIVSDSLSQSALIPMFKAYKTVRPFQTKFMKKKENLWI